MAHIIKYNKSGTWHTIAHDRREHTQGRENIDKSLSYLNYNLCDKPEFDYLQKRIDDVKNSGGMVRDNSVVLASVIVTLPKTFLDNETLQKQFFRSCKQFLDNDFGKENCVSCWIHLDEPNAQPHMHYKFTPIMKKRKKYKDGREKEFSTFDAKHILDRAYFQKFHIRLSEYIKDELGFDVDILTGETKEMGNKTVAELKKQKIKKQNEEIKKNYDIIKSQKENNIIKSYEQKQILNELWLEYKDISKRYWTSYQSKKKDISNSIWELKRGISGTEQQLKKDLDFLSNLHFGVVFALCKLVGAIFTYYRDKHLKENLKAIQGNLEELETARRRISNYQEATKQNLKKEDLESIETALTKWENEIIQTNNEIRNTIEHGEDEPERVENKALEFEECR